MGVVIDLQARRLGVELEQIQSGMEIVANYLDTETPRIGNSHQGYGVIGTMDDESISVGKAGLADFSNGFEGVLTEKVRETASFAYGAFFAGKLLLPEVVMRTPAAARRFTGIVDKNLQHNPDADFAVTAEFTAARAAASLSIMALWGTFRDLGPAARLSFTQRVRSKAFPPANSHMALLFAHRMNERVLLRMLDKPVPSTK